MEKYLPVQWYSTLLVKRLCISFCALALLIGTFFIAPPHTYATNGITQCHQYTIPVHMSSLDLTTYHVAAWLCYNQTPGDLVQLTVHGATYNHSYWDFSCTICQSNTYSYVQYMGQRGYTTFTYDRLGNGASDHPLPELVTLQTDAYVLSQLINDLKTGAYGGPTFHTVILVGHSVGSAISIAEASNPSLVSPDGVILSGFIHFVNPVELVTLATEIEPASLDPDPRFHNLPPGYLTTDPGTRGQLFYYQPEADPGVIAQDESTKDTITDSELATFFTIEGTTVSRQIHVPVLEVLGQDDNIFCLGTFNCTNSQNVQQYEAPFFSAQAQLQVLVIPQAGHDLNLQENASVWENAAVQWISSYFS